MPLAAGIVVKLTPRLDFSSGRSRPASSSSSPHGSTSPPAARGRHRRQAILITMSDEPGKIVEPPPLPAVLLDPQPVIAVGALLWLVAAVAAFVVPALTAWRPLTLAGLVVGVLGTSIFLWQRAAARRGARGAQTGLTTEPRG